MELTKYQLLDGKALSNEIKEEIAAEVVKMKANGGKVPHLAAILVGKDGASETYVASKVKACEKVGFRSSLFKYEDSISEEELLRRINDVNNNDDIDGLIVQLPLPDHISVPKVIQAVSPEKDVDGFHPISVGRMAKGLPTFISATPYGIMLLLEKYNIPTRGKHAVVVGRSHIVGGPVSMLMNRPMDCTVTLTHKYTEGLEKYTKEADIIIVAVGKPGLITADMVKDGVVIVDVGITRVEDTNAPRGYVLKGDVDFDSVAEKCSYITPVPGGVGPMTIAALLKNTLKSAKKEVYG